MAMDSTVEKLVKNAVERCKERVLSTKKRVVERGLNQSAQTGVQGEPPCITGSMKRLRGL
ncbi:MAG TPA: hypothetical protein VKO45_01115 [Methanomicrobiales archaeon]|nr:hypothetical protein [Methanomicrobiales archaeon]